MKSKLLVLSAAILLVASCKKVDNSALTSGDVAANVESTSMAKQKCKESHKLTGTLVYDASTAFNLPCNCGSYVPLGNYYGTGELSHLGTATSKIKPCMAPIIANNQMIGMHIGAECGTLVAANGDKINCDIKPYDLLFGPTGATGIVRVEFDGGTGRFDDADGGFTAITQGDATGSHITLKILSGSIEY